MDKTMCCFIGQDGKSCKSEAEFEVIYGNAPGDVTESCARHSGQLVDDRIERFEVVRISGGIMEGDTVRVKGSLEGQPSETYKIVHGKNGNLILNDDMGTDLMELNPRVVQKLKKDRR